MAKDTRVTFDSATNNNNGTNGAMSPNGVGGGPGGGGGGPGGFSLGHHHNSLAPHQQPLPSHHHSHHPHKPSSKMGRGHSRIAERQVSTEDAENCINEISESFPALSNKAHRLMRQVSGSFNSRTLKVALIFSIMLNIVMGISFGVFFGMWMSWDRSSGADGEIDRISGSRSNPGHISNLPHTLPYYYPPPKTDIHTDTHAKNKNPFEAVCAYCSTIPCSQSPSTVGVSPGNGGKDKCICMNEALQTELKTLSAAHMMLDVYTTKQNKKLTWLTHDDDNICYVGKGLRYANGELTVLHSGNYYVYSQVTFSTIDNRMPAGHKEILLLFSIQRRQRSSKSNLRQTPYQTLLLSKLTMEPDREENDSVSGVVQLNEGDVLSVYISHPSLLKNILPANYFGVKQL